MRILRWLFLGFLLIPIFEIFLLIKVGGIIGAIPTILLVILTAVLGGVLMRQQGFATLMRVRQGMERGEVPAAEMLEGVIILFSGALLLLPGFFTDVVGVLGLIPPVRRALVLFSLRRALVRTRSDGRTGRDPHVIEGEFRREDDPRIPPP